MQKYVRAVSIVDAQLLIQSLFWHNAISMHAKKNSNTSTILDFTGPIELRRAIDDTIFVSTPFEINQIGKKMEIPKRVYDI